MLVSSFYKRRDVLMSIKIFNDQGATYLIQKIKTLISGKADSNHTHDGMITSASINTTYNETTQALSVNLNVS